jgi:sugar/nucleoside kinase (ribokinase family)
LERLHRGAVAAALVLSQHSDQVITTPEELESLLESSSLDIFR